MKTGMRNVAMMGTAGMIGAAGDLFKLTRSFGFDNPFNFGPVIRERVRNITRGSTKISESRYTAHQGKRECARRQRQKINGVVGGQYPEYENLVRRNVASGKWVVAA